MKIITGHSREGPNVGKGEIKVDGVEQAQENGQLESVLSTYYILFPFSVRSHSLIHV